MEALERRIFVVREVEPADLVEVEFAVDEVVCFGAVGGGGEEEEAANAISFLA